MNEILKYSYRFLVFVLDWKLQANAVLMLCNLRRLLLPCCHRHKILFDYLRTRNVDWVRNPLINVLNRKFVVNILKNPVTQKVFLDLTLNVEVTGHYQGWL